MRLTLEPQEEVNLQIAQNDIRVSRFHQQLANDYFSIEQTCPEIVKEHINEIVLLTYQKNNETSMRFGFEARIKAITSDNNIIMYKLNDPAPCDLRSWPRIKKSLLPDMRAKCQKKESQVVDISSNGTHIILYESDSTPKIGAKVKLKFIFDKDDVNIEGKILRKWEDQFHRLHMAICFEENDNISKIIYK